MEENKEKFTYSYSAKDRDEITIIREKYLPKQADKMAELRRLDAKVGTRAIIAALAVGVIGTLIFGVGLCCCLVWAESLFVPGIVIGVLGFGILGSAYPIYQRIYSKDKEHFAPQILQLTEELMGRQTEE